MDILSVKLARRKQGKRGRISLYLVYYKGTVPGPDGKVKVLRDYEYLNLYLDDKPGTALEKEHNRKILELARLIRAERELEIKTRQFGFDAGAAKKKSLLLEYFKAEAGGKPTAEEIEAAACTHVTLKGG